MRARFATSRPSSSSAATAALRSICASRSRRSAGRSTGWSRSSASRCSCATVSARRRPTPGRLLFERSQPILRQLEDAAAEIKSTSAGTTGTIVIAIPPGVGHFLLAPLVERYRKSFPNTSLKIISGFSGTIHEALVRGRADVACLHGPLPQKGFRIIPLLEEEAFLVGKRGTLPARRAHVSTAELLGLPLILPSRQHTSRRILEERAFAPTPPSTPSWRSTTRR